MSLLNPKAPAPEFVFNGFNYLLKMKSDSLFLSGSIFERFYEFSKKTDPFL
jgi:hypothetical protein